MRKIRRSTKMRTSRRTRRITRRARRSTRRGKGGGRGILDRTRTGRRISEGKEEGEEKKAGEEEEDCLNLLLTYIVNQISVTFYLQYICRR